MPKSNKVKKAREKISTWSARGGKCPICQKQFRYGCNHSISQAEDRLQENLINAIIEKRLTR